MDLKMLKVASCAALIGCSFFFFLCPNALCTDPVRVQGGLLSVNLKDTSLLEVARDIEKQSGIWFRGDETLFQENISVTFNDLPLEEGLKRILTNMNYSLVFDNKHKVAGVMVMGEGKAAGAQPARPGAQPPRVASPPGTASRPSATLRSRSSTSTPPAATVVRRPPRALPQRNRAAGTQPQPGSVGAPSVTPDDSEAQENASTAEGPLPPAFRVMENPAPPGGTPQGTAASPEGPTGTTSSPSSGNPSKSDSTP
jgi:type II secretory pathway component GspD/PulD (secretin)